MKQLSMVLAFLFSIAFSEAQDVPSSPLVGAQTVQMQLDCVNMSASAREYADKHGLCDGDFAPLCEALSTLRVALNVSKGEVVLSLPQPSSPTRLMSCTASCHLAVATPGANCSGYVWGSGVGKTYDIACNAAKNDANLQVPRGCYKRHCQCTCGQMWP
jgi:hypothetical protein